MNPLTYALALAAHTVRVLLLAAALALYGAARIAIAAIYFAAPLLSIAARAAVYAGALAAPYLAAEHFYQTTGAPMRPREVAALAATTVAIAAPLLIFWGEIGERARARARRCLALADTTLETPTRHTSHEKPRRADR